MRVFTLTAWTGWSVRVERLILSGMKWSTTRVVNSGSGYLSGSSRRQHFGLGEATRVDEVEIQWPSGHRTLLRDLPADRSYRVAEDLEVAGPGVVP